MLQISSRIYPDRINGSKSNTTHKPKPVNNSAPQNTPRGFSASGDKSINSHVVHYSFQTKQSNPRQKLQMGPTKGSHNPPSGGFTEGQYLDNNTPSHSLQHYLKHIYTYKSIYCQLYISLIFTSQPLDLLVLKFHQRSLKLTLSITVKILNFVF